MSDTGIGGDCFFNQDSCWLIRYAIPAPKRIQYRYGTGDWITVEGETWSTVVTSASYNLQPGVSYRVFWDAVSIYGGMWSNNYNGGSWPFASVTGNFNVFRECPFQWGDGCAIGFSSERGNELIGFRIGNLIEVPFLRSGANFNVVLSNTFSVKQVQRVSDGAIIPPTSSCRFRIFNFAGQTVLDITSETCPEVREFPCTNENAQLREIVLTPEDRPKVFSLTTVLRVRTETLTDRVCRVVELVSLLPFVPNIFIQPVLRICSPIGCFIPPYVDYSCNKGCDCEKCPDGHCFACEENGIVCCYGSDGSVLKTFPLAKKCPDQDLC